MVTTILTFMGFLFLLIIIAGAVLFVVDIVKQTIALNKEEKEINSKNNFEEEYKNTKLNESL